MEACGEWLARRPEASNRTHTVSGGCTVVTQRTSCHGLMFCRQIVSVKLFLLSHRPSYPKEFHCFYFDKPRIQPQMRDNL